MKMSRRGFLGCGLALGLGTWAGASNRRNFWQRIADRFPAYTDDKTGARVFNLTPGKEHANQTVYQTHPMWSRDMRYLLFTSNRSGTGNIPHVLDTETGDARPLPGPPGAFAKAIHSENVYVIAQNQCWITTLEAAFDKEPAAREIAPLPPHAHGVSGTFTTDMKESSLYLGTTLEPEKRWGLLALDLRSRQWRTICEVDFQVGHLQASPFHKGHIMFCYETGGDSPQRTWFVRADGTGLAPFYKETYGEWVTHEVWWKPNTIVFTVWPYDDAHKRQPHGVALAKRKSGGRGKMTVLSQYPAWHTHGSPDGRRVMGDDFERNIWLIDSKTKTRSLLTQGHLGAGFSTHPHGSFTPDGQGVLFTSSREGYEAVFLARCP